MVQLSMSVPFATTCDQTYFRVLTLFGVDVLCELNLVIALVGDLIPQVVLLLLLLLHVELQLRIHKHSD